MKELIQLSSPGTHSGLPPYTDTCASRRVRRAALHAAPLLAPPSPDNLLKPAPPSLLLRPRCLPANCGP